MNHPDDAILRIKRVRDSFGPDRPGLKETKDAIEACDWDEARTRALLIERGHAREHVHMWIVGKDKSAGEPSIELWVPVNASFAEICTIIDPLVGSVEPANFRAAIVRMKARAAWETLRANFGVSQGDPGLPGPVQR